METSESADTIHSPCNKCRSITGAARPNPVIRLLDFPALKAPFDQDGDEWLVIFDQGREHLPTSRRYRENRCG
jgi:hypothetical protein